MTITDKRTSGKNKSVGNRQKFIKRYKHRIKRSVDSIASDKGITDVLKDRKIVINNDEIEEPNFNFDLTTGERDIILPGNRSLQKGDKIHRPPKDEEEGTEGSDKGEGLDEFSFVLTKEEFLDLYFSDMALPSFIKESLKGTNKYKFKRTGYSKDGIPPRLDLVKTLKQAMARRIATKSSRYLDDIDLRYKHFTKQPYPVRQAVMIMLMDVSGSMGEYEKMIAKKFFLLLYLFLHKVYKTVEVRFVSHTQEAKEVDEKEFFYGKETGGTIISAGLKKVNEIVNEVDLSTTNVYIAQASDGDNWGGDENLTENLVVELLGKVQYFAYIQTEHPDRIKMKAKYGVQDVMSMYEKIAEAHRNLQARHVVSESEVYPVLRSLFEKD
jgi:uncharacterized sporulation protein YeaH/YhbH (DUF444 family)